MGTSVDASMYLRPVNHEIRKIIFGMRSSSAGSDPINLFVLKTAFPSISHVFTSLVYACFKQGKFPNCLKIARITPVFKGGNKNELGNYRPISLLPIVSRVLEKCINIRFYEHLERHRRLHPNPFGFRKGRTTERAISFITTIINDALDRKLRVAGIFLDLIKAFDTVDNRILLKNVNFMD